MRTAFSVSQFGIIRRTWAESTAFRWLLVASLVYFLLRLSMQLMLVFDPASQEIAADLQTYLNAARAFQQRQDLYLPGALSVVNFYQYAPFYALAFSPFLLLSPLAVTVVHLLLHLGAYGLLYLWWLRIFRRLGLEKAGKWMAWSLPVWVIFSAFWADLTYLNIYVIVALLATLLIDAVLDEQPGWAALWLALILQVKPQWAFAALLPLLLGRRAFFARLVGLAALGYIGTILVTAAVGGSYALHQYLDYFRFLSQMSAHFPWRGPETGFLGYNHSIKQVVLFWLGIHPGSLAVADALKILLLVPLGLVALAGAFSAQPRAQPETAREDPHRFLELAFALYLGAFLWLDIVWELTLGIAVFVYLLATMEDRWGRVLVWIAFLTYALLDLWQIMSYLVFGPRILIQDAYIATDPSIYAPVILAVILVFYGILVGRLWRTTAWPGRMVQWNWKRS